MSTRKELEDISSEDIINLVLKLELEVGCLEMEIEDVYEEMLDLEGDLV